MRVRAIIVEAAYYRAEQRGFERGHDVEDWCAAEARLSAMRRYSTRHHPQRTRCEHPTQPATPRFEMRLHSVVVNVPSPGRS